MKKALCGMIATAVLATTLHAGIAQAQIALSVTIAPPALPIYVQPPMPGDGYLWTPGYWGWNEPDQDYFWVPGTWVAAPYVGALWTPGYWGWGGGGYAWHGGYWGSHIGFYGGVNYGFGYTGVGYQGGYWNEGAFRYNRNANNFGSRHITNVYNTRIENSRPSRVSFNGGNGGIRLAPTRGEQSIANMPHSGQTAPQAQHEQAARANPDLRSSVNHGMPRVAATPEPGAFNAPGVVAARPAAPSREQPRSQPTAQSNPARGRQEMSQAQQPQAQQARPQPEMHQAPQARAQQPQPQQARPQPEMRQVPQARAQQPQPQQARPQPEMHQAPQAGPQRAAPQRQENNHDEQHHDK